MTDQKEKVKLWLAECKVDNPLKPQDPRYLDLSAVPIDGGNVNLRGLASIANVQRCIEFQMDYTCQLFSGYPGTGKTTELERLRQLLTSDGYKVLWMDASELHTLNHPLTIEDMAIIMAAGIGSACADFLGKGLAKDGYLERFEKFLRQDLDFTEIRFKGPLDIKAGLKSGNPAWLAVRKHLSGSLGALLNDCTGYIQQSLDRVRTSKDERIVVIVDSLEKLRDTETFMVTMKSLETIFREYSNFLRLENCHTIYTIPPYLELAGFDISEFYDGIQVLPAIKVSERYEEQPTGWPHGIEAMKQLLGKRIPLDEVFGSDHAGLDELILYSGGHIRTLLQMMVRLIMDGAATGFPVSHEAVRATIRFFKGKLANLIPPEDLAILDVIRKNNNLKELPRAMRSAVPQLMSNRQVLCYHNGEEWYEIHPLIRDEVKNRVAAREAGP